MDWNLVIHVLDELRDGPQPLLPFANIASRHDRASCMQTTLFLSDRELIALSTVQYPFTSVAREEWPDRLRAAFAEGDVDPVASGNTAIDLTDQGKQVLQLFGIGHP